MGLEQGLNKCRSVEGARFSALLHLLRGLQVGRGSPRTPPSFLESAGYRSCLVEVRGYEGCDRNRSASALTVIVAIESYRDVGAVDRHAQ